MLPRILVVPMAVLSALCRMLTPNVSLAVLLSLALVHSDPWGKISQPRFVLLCFCLLLLVFVFVLSRSASTCSSTLDISSRAASEYWGSMRGTATTEVSIVVQYSYDVPLRADIAAAYSTWYGEHIATP